MQNQSKAYNIINSPLREKEYAWKKSEKASEFITDQMKGISLPKPVGKDYKKMTVSSNAKTAMQDFRNTKSQENVISPNEYNNFLVLNSKGMEICDLHGKNSK